MANTYTLIQTQTIAVAAASLTFSSIPATYTDLVLRTSTRNSGVNTGQEFYITFNSDSTTLYSITALKGNGATPTSNREATQPKLNMGLNPGSTSTSNTFDNSEFYIPSYLSTTNKALMGFDVNENNTTNANILNTAGLYRNTIALSSMTLTSADTFIIGSSFYLYGIKNS